MPAMHHASCAKLYTLNRITRHLAVLAGVSQVAKHLALYSSFGTCAYSSSVQAYIGNVEFAREAVNATS